MPAINEEREADANTRERCQGRLWAGRRERSLRRMEVCGGKESLPSQKYSLQICQQERSLCIGKDSSARHRNFSVSVCLTPVCPTSLSLCAETMCASEVALASLELYSPGWLQTRHPAPQRCNYTACHDAWLKLGS